LSNVQGTFGADITANKDGSTITGTKNADQITLGAATDTVKFLTAAGNGSDTILNFTKGATAGDVLNVSGLASLVGSGGTGGIASTNAVYVGATTAGTKADTAVSKVAVIGAADNASADWANVLTKIGGALTIAADTTAANANTVVLISNGTDTRVYLFSDDATSNTTVEAGEVTLVGTLSNVVTASFVEANFALA
jgi:flagellin